MGTHRMADKVLPGNPPINLHLRQSAQARRISLRISQADGRVTLTLPKGVPETEALGFAEEKAGWIRRHLAQRAKDVTIAHGARLPIEGELCEIRPSTGRAVTLEGPNLHVPGEPARVGSRVQGFLKARARLRLASAVQRHASALGRSFTAITLRDTRSRWGSCTSQGRLMFSWRLVMAPPAVLDYVAAHEVAHLAEMNHSPVFWHHVEALYGDYAPARRWLRQEGGALHRYQFCTRLPVEDVPA
jgi:predicted metal-dependent hydrolase